MPAWEAEATPRPMPSSKPAHHRFRPVPSSLLFGQADAQAAREPETGRLLINGELLREFSRSDAHRRWFGLAPALAAHAFDSLGSERLNIVYAGACTYENESDDDGGGDS